MPCPAIELGWIWAIYRDAEFSGRTTRHSKRGVRGWRKCACGAFGHGMPCPYWTSQEERVLCSCMSSAHGAAFLRWHRRHFSYAAYRRTCATGGVNEGLRNI
jgi:hypothetical protein